MSFILSTTFATQVHSCIIPSQFFHPSFIIHSVTTTLTMMTTTMMMAMILMMILMVTMMMMMMMTLLLMMIVVVMKSLGAGHPSVCVMDFTMFVESLTPIFRFL